MNRLKITSPSYPKLLSQISHPPQILYYKGNLNLLKIQCVAVVGPRKASAYGKKNTINFVTALARAGFCIVSGLAIGIDSIAHKAALDSQGQTIAILGGGIDNAFPALNYQLYEQITKKGLILSEYPPGTPGYASHFPERNRIISGLSIATLVIEARIRSGSLITANQAFQQNRDVYAIPGSISDPTNEGVHKLISFNKAKLIHSPEQLLSELTGTSQLHIPFGTRATQAALAPEESILIGLLRSEPLTTEQLSTQSQKPLHSVSILLTTLELKGLIQKIGGARYQAI